MATLFTMHAELALDTSKFDAEVKKATSSGQALGDALQSGGDGLQGALEGAGVAADAVGSKLASMSQKSIVALKKMAQAMDKVNASLASGSEEIPENFFGAYETAMSHLDFFGRENGLSISDMKNELPALWEGLSGVKASSLYSSETAREAYAAMQNYVAELEKSVTASEKAEKSGSKLAEAQEAVGKASEKAGKKTSVFRGVLKSLLTKEAITRAARAVVNFGQESVEAAAAVSPLGEAFEASMERASDGISQLKVHIGNALLPAVISVADAIANIMPKQTAQEAYEQYVGGLKTDLQSDLASIAANKAIADKYTETIERLQDKTALNAQEQAEWQAAVEGLVSIYPELSSIINTTTGEIEGGAAAVRDMTKALNEQAVAAAKQKVLQTVYEDVVAKEVEAVQAEQKHSRLYGEYIKSLGEYDSAMAEIGEKYGSAFVDSISYAMEKADLASAIDVMRQVLPTEYWAEAETSIRNTLVPLAEAAVGAREASEEQYRLAVSAREASDVATQEASETSAAIEALDGKVLTLGSSTAQTESKLDGMNGELDTAAGKAEDATGPIEDLSSALASVGMGEGQIATITAIFDSIPMSAEEATAAVADFSQRLHDLRQQQDSTRSALEAARKEASEYADTMRQQVAKSIDSVYDGYSKVNKIRPMSAKQQEKNAKAQMQQLEDYAANLQKLEEMGVGSELLAELSDGSADSMSRAAGLASSSQASLDSYLATLDKLQQYKADAGEGLLANILGTDEEYQKMQGNIKSLADELGNLTSFKTITNIGLASFGLSALTTSLDGLDGREVSPTIVIDEAPAKKAVQNIQSAIDSVTGKTVRIGVSFGGFGGDLGDLLGLPGHASGLDYVPYDNYVARLHTGEAVLTKAEARQWRDGNSKGSGRQQAKQFTINQNISAVPMSAQELAVQTAAAFNMMRFNT